MNPAVRAIGRAALAAHPVPLDEAAARAELLDRFDRTYLVPLDIFEDFAALLTDPRRPGGHFRALSINGRRWFKHRSTFYDTPDLRTFQDHRQGRRERYEIRERLYEDSGHRALEVSVQGSDGRTITHRRPLEGREHALDEAHQGFLSGVLHGAYGVEAPAGLVPGLESELLRATFVADGQRVTCDAGLVVRDLAPGGRTLKADSGLVVVRTKTDGPQDGADQLLRRYGVAESDFAAYASALMALRPELGTNRWTPAIRTAFPNARRTAA